MLMTDDALGHAPWHAVVDELSGVRVPQVMGAQSGDLAARHDPRRSLGVDALSVMSSTLVSSVRAVPGLFPGDRPETRPARTRAGP